MALVPVKYYNKSTYGYPASDDTAAMRLVGALVGNAGNKGPLYAYKPSFIVAPAGDAPTTGVGTPGEPATMDGITLWRASFQDLAPPEAAELEWITNVNARSALAAAPAHNTFSAFNQSDINYSDSPECTVARSRLWSRLRKYGAMYGINVNSMARAMTTKLISLKAENNNVAFVLSNANYSVAPEFTQISLAAALLRPIEIYTRMIGAPPILDPSGLPDGGTLPMYSRMSNGGDGLRYKKRRRKSYRR